MDLFTLVGKIAVDATEATNNIQVVIDKVNELNLVLNGTENNAQGAAKATGEAITDATDDVTQKTQSTFSQWSVMMGNLATQAANKAYSIGKSFFQTGFEYNRNMEKWTASIKTYLGNDLEEAVKLVGQLQQFAVDTPLSMEEVMKQAVQLLATGTGPDQLIETLRVIGDLSKGDMGIFASVSRAYWQIMTTGRLLAQDANQLTQAGVPIWQIMTDYFNHIGRDGNTGWEVRDTRDLATAAFLQKNPALAITDEEVMSALRWSTTEGHMYFNAMNNVMDTEYGRAQKMMDEYTMSAGAFTQAIFDIFSSDTIPALSDIFKQLNEWATKNPDALKNLGEALSDLATGGIDLLLTSLQSLLSFWNDNQDMFNAMLVLFGGLAIKSGHPAAGMALITAGGYNVWDDWVKENQKEFSGLTSDVDLPFIRQQLEYQGKADQWDAYLENWKNARKGEGYSDTDIEGFIAEQFKNYVPVTDEQMDAMVTGYQWDGPDSYENGGMSAWDAFRNKLELWNWGNDNGSGVNENGHGGGFRRFGLPDGVDVDGTGGSMGIVGTLAAIQSTLASLPAEVQSAASTGVAEGVGDITITGTITTGDVKLDSGTVVGEIIPTLDLKLGAANARAGRGA